jgi:3-oxoacyl-[acyl-carrier protein] reductase
MDLGIAGKKALVCGASAGLGYACAQALVREGVDVLIVARNEAPLLAAAEHLGRMGAGTVQCVTADVTTEAGRARIFAAQQDFDIVVTNAGGPPPGDFRDWDRDTWLRAMDANMLAPIALIKATVDGMMARGFGRIVNITSSAVKSPVDGLGLSNGARSGLTGFVAGLARSTVARGVTINNLLPGTFDTARLAGNFAAQAARQGISTEQAIAARLAKHPAHRFGRPDELGNTCAYVCSVHAGYINGQNILLDGGSFPGVF